MTDKVENENAPATPRRTTVVYSKFFALLGIAGGLGLAFGTPGVFLAFHEGFGQQGQELVESLPEWTVPTLLCIGMGGGVLIALFSTCFGLLIPSRVIRE